MLLIVDAKDNHSFAHHNNTALRERERETKERDYYGCKAHHTSHLSPHLTSTYSSTLRSSFAMCIYLYLT
jgi:hypothetical protein